MKFRIDTIQDLKQVKKNCKLEQVFSVKNLPKSNVHTKNHRYSLNQVLIIGKLNKMLKRITILLVNLIQILFKTNLFRINIKLLPQIELIQKIVYLRGDVQTLLLIMYQIYLL